MKIGKVELRQGGVKGLKVQYIDQKKVGTFDFLNDYNVKFSMPVVGALKKKMEAGFGFAKDILRLKNTIDTKDIHILAVEGDGDKVRMKVRVNSFDGTFYEVETPWIEGESFYENSKLLFVWFDEVVKLATEYVERGESLNARQFVMDFKAANPKDKSLQDIDFDTVEDSELLVKMQHCLEKNGRVVLSPDDMAAAV